MHFSLSFLTIYYIDKSLQKTTAKKAEEFHQFSQELTKVKHLLCCCADLIQKTHSFYNHKKKHLFSYTDFSVTPSVQKVLEREGLDYEFTLV